jgi:hypothetical protein
MGVVITGFSKIESRLKALYVRLKGISEGGLKALKTKGFRWAINSNCRNSQNPYNIYQITLGKESS